MSRNRVKRTRVHTRRTKRYVRKKIEEIPWPVIWCLIATFIVWIIFGYFQVRSN